METSEQPRILILGNDTALAYLIGRYGEQSGYAVIPLPVAAQAESVCAMKPAAILFTSIASLEAGQILIAGLANCEIPVLVCSSIADQAHARELGADHCLLHPLTYSGFHKVLAAIRSPGGNGL